ncbi:exported hypothetical protein [uncultured Gammaproteobacteria bacterium]
MKKLLVAVLVGLLPVNASAQTQPVAQTSAVEAERSMSTWTIVIGGIGGILVADLLLGRPLTQALFGSARVVRPLVAAPAAPLARPLAAAAAPLARPIAAAPLVVPPVPHMTLLSLPPELRAAQDAGGTIGELIKPLNDFADARARRGVINGLWIAFGGGVGAFIGNTISKVYAPVEN